MNLKTLAQGLPDIGEVFYLVDTNYRTGAQGWSTADHTGPLDLYDQRNHDRVFYTAGTGNSAARLTDTLAIQAAIDAMVDFRGDTLFWTPGSYLPLTAVAVNVPDARWLWRPVRHAGAASATITAGITLQFGMTAAADRMELGFLRFVPLTAEHMFAIATGANGQHWHHFCYDSTGIGASTATQLMLVDGSWDNTLIEDFINITDAAQGPMIELDGTVLGLTVRNFIHYHLAGTLAVAILDVDGAGSTGITIGPGHGQIGGAGIVTDTMDLADLTAAATNLTLKQFTCSVGWGTATSQITAAGTTVEADIVDSWIATILGGAGRAAITA